jgi:NAD(P)-dependent dehydrogenase (short-subunit alcohol dehydrogenase family)
MPEDRTALVVGAGPGLGESVARRFADAGWTVGLTARTTDRVEQLADDLTAETDGRGVSAPGDVTDSDDVSDVVETVRADAGRIDALVYTVYANGAGHESFADTTIEDVDHAYDTELKGLFRFAKRVAPAMQERGDGAILATGSVLSTAGAPELAARSASRGGVRELCRSLARELGPDGVHVAHVLVDGWIDDPDVRAQHPDRGDDLWLDPDEIADTYYHLATQAHSAWSFEVDLRPHGDDLSAVR